MDKIFKKDNYTNTECPNCGANADCIASIEFDEESIFCQNCGFFYNRILKRDSEGIVITKDGTDNYDMDNVYYQETYLGDPYGSFEFQKDGKTEKTGSLGNEVDYRKIKNQFEKSDFDILIVRRLIEGVFTISTLKK